MELLKFLKKAPPDLSRWITISAMVSGVFNVALVVIINQACEKTAAGRTDSLYLLSLYLLAFAIYYQADKMALSEANLAVEDLLYELRVRLADKVRKMNLEKMERLGSGDLFSRFSQATRHLSESFQVFVNAIQTVTLLVFFSLYVLYLSPTAAAFIGLTSALAVGFFLFQRPAQEKAQEEIDMIQAEVFDDLRHFVGGYKELRLSQRKNDALYSKFQSTGQRLKGVSVGAGRGWVHTIVLVNLFQYILMGVLLFVVPHFAPGVAENSLKITMACLFCFGPLISVVGMLPLYTQVEVGLRRLTKLESELDEDDMEFSPSDTLELSTFKQLSYREISFTYQGMSHKRGFHSGPWSLDIKRGERIFVIGGNGSGKSTAMKLITGLYSPSGGEVNCDGQTVGEEHMANLRALYSCVFSDFHLFDKLYGQQMAEPERVTSLLERMKLGDKVTYSDGRFSTTKLSTGQRKRLALVSAMLEDRPVYVFDEWAADQDTHFRDEFYHRILDELRDDGKTVIAVTHDDRYWHLADRLVKFDLGRIIEVNA